MVLSCKSGLLVVFFIYESEVPYVESPAPDNMQDMIRHLCES